MKISSTVLALVAAAATGSAQAQQEFLPDAPLAKQEGVKYALLKPSDKTMEMVKTTERNPFAKADEGNSPSQKSLNEETLIRERLEKLRVVGVSPGTNGLRVMLGDIVLESGQMVPDLLPEQTVALKVGAITAQTIELLWLEARPDGLPPRKLTIPVDLRPYVRYQLQGFPTNKNQWEKKKETALPVGRVFPDVSAAPQVISLKQVVENQPATQSATAPAEGARPLAELPVEAPDRASSQPGDTAETFVKTKAPK
jgi:hypothetical protein